MQELVLEDPFVDDDINPRRVRNQVPCSSCRAVCSSSIAARQLGLDKALQKVFGMGDKGAVWYRAGR